MVGLLAELGTTITGLVGQLASVTTALIDNELFVLGFSVTVISIMIGLATSFLKKRKSGR